MIAKGRNQKLVVCQQCWAPQIYTLSRNRKFRKIAMGGPQPQIRKFLVRLHNFCSSATANDFLFPQT